MDAAGLGQIAIGLGYWRTMPGETAEILRGKDRSRHSKSDL
jgi:hypothetical protein